LDGCKKDKMKSVIEYHWLEETTDENGNIESVERIQTPYFPDSKNVEVCVKQDVWNGDGSDFGYAYLNLKTKSLPSHFDNGRKVPAKFHNQVEKLNK